MDLLEMIFVLFFPVPFRHGERIGFSYLVSQKYTGEKALVKVLRNSKILEFSIKLATHKRLVPAHIKGRPPSYYIVAGFVFAAVSVPYLRSEVLVTYCSRSSYFLVQVDANFWLYYARDLRVWSSYSFGLLCSGLSVALDVSLKANGIIQSSCYNSIRFFF